MVSSLQEAIEQWLRLPFMVAGQVLGWLGETAVELARTGDGARRRAQGPGDLLPPATRERPRPPAAAESAIHRAAASVVEARPSSLESNRQEKSEMADTNLHDDMVKLVEYTLVSIERGHETKLEGPEQIIVTDDLTGDAFSNARVASWFKETSGKHKYKDEDGKDQTRAVDSETLRVYYRVLDRWPKEDLKKDERQVEYLRQIAENTRKAGASK